MRSTANANGSPLRRTTIALRRRVGRAAARPKISSSRSTGTASPRRSIMSITRATRRRSAAAPRVCRRSGPRTVRPRSSSWISSTIATGTTKVSPPHTNENASTIVMLSGIAHRERRALRRRRSAMRQLAAQLVDGDALDDVHADAAAAGGGDLAPRRQPRPAQQRQQRRRRRPGPARRPARATRRRVDAAPVVGDRSARAGCRSARSSSR